MRSTVLRLRPHDGTRALGVVWLTTAVMLAFFLTMLGVWNGWDAVLALALVAGVLVPAVLAVQNLRLALAADDDGVRWTSGFRTRRVGWDSVRAVHEPPPGLRQQITLELTDGRTLRLPSLTRFAILEQGDPGASEPGGEVGAITLAHFRWQLQHGDESPGSAGSPDSRASPTGPASPAGPEDA
jgi:hypothetical protein